ncbi:MAG: hypothetical protein CR993_05785 [Rhodobacterales bacterium]|nr:MAG: hypothetical protein CR993_05785 [Rhodobacterales bacterium]
MVGQGGTEGGRIMNPWFSMMLAGAIALVGGLFALINPTQTAITTIALVGWSLILVAALQGWAAYRAVEFWARIRAAAIAVATGFLGISMIFGPFGDGTLMRWLVGLLLIASGASKAWAAYGAMSGSQNQMLVYGTGAVSALLGLVILLGMNMDFGLLLGIELLASGLGLVLLAMQRRSKARAQNATERAEP